MATSRRKFIKRAALGGLAGSAMISQKAMGIGQEDPELDGILKESVINLEGLDLPLIIKSVELLRKGDNFLCRVYTEDGAVVC